MHVAYLKCYFCFIAVLYDIAYLALLINSVGEVTISFQASSSATSASLGDKWIQDTATAIKLPALSPAVCNVLLSLVEGQVKKMCQQALKFQKRAKKSTLTGLYDNFA